LWGEKNPRNKKREKKTENEIIAITRVVSEKTLCFRPLTCTREKCQEGGKRSQPSPLALTKRPRSKR